MKIKRIYISGYKNLSACEIRPNGIHAVTGCNSCGKSNLLEVFPFIAAFLSVSGKQRKEILEQGRAPNGMIWHPFVEDPKLVEPFRFELEAELSAKKGVWLISYSIEFEKPTRHGGMYTIDGPNRVKSEEVYIKQINRPGPKRRILKRDLNGNTIVSSEKEKRKKISFKTKLDSSALQALDVREADNFIDTYPVLSLFYFGITESGIVRIDPVKVFSGDSPLTSLSRNVVESFDIIQALEIIEETNQKEEFLFWADRLCDVSDISIDEDDRKKIKFVFIKQKGVLLLPQELSLGTSFILGILLVIYSFRPYFGPLIIEEPESHIHPKAVIDLVAFLRTISEDTTILISTHSPVVINSLNPKEVTLIKPLGNGLATTFDISESKEALDTLERGYISFGDLLQNNFLLEDTNGQ